MLTMVSPFTLYEITGVLLFKAMANSKGYDYAKASRHFLGGSMLHRVLSVFFTLLFLSSQPHSHELTVGFAAGKPPFVYTENEIHKGMEIDIVRAALSYKGHSIKKILIMPYPRLQLDVNDHHTDARAGVQKPLSQASNNFYSDNYIAFENYAISLKEANINLTELADLKNYSLVTWKSAYQHLDATFNATYNPASTIEHRKYTEFVDQRAQVEFFLRKRAEVIVIDKSIFYWQLKSFMQEENSAHFQHLLKDQAFVFFNVSPEPTAFRVNFSDEQVRDDFNEGLRELKASGEYQAILDKYK